MGTIQKFSRIILVSFGCSIIAPGCASTKTRPVSLDASTIQVTNKVPRPSDEKIESVVTLVSHRHNPATPQDAHHAKEPSDLGKEGLNQATSAESLAELEAISVSNNPTLRRLQQEAFAERAKVGYVGKLPDPTISSLFYTPPMNFEPDRQLAELQLMQMIPWLGRLNAETQRACLEAMAAEAMYRAERLRVIGDLRSAWFKLYVLGKQIEAIEADQEQLESLIKSATARVATGAAQPGDVLMATLELSALEDQLITYRQQVVATAAELNRLMGRDTSIPIAPPSEITARLPEWDHDLLKQLALNAQPEVNIARLRAAATRWGIEVARLKRRPDLTMGAGWVSMDAPSSMAPNAGRDSFTLGVTASIPLYRGKYDAMTTEAIRQHAAAHASEEEIALQLDAMLRDLWEQARAGQQSIELYEMSILPQANQTLEANQKSLGNNVVPFDRIIRDYRTLLNLELGYHRALGQLATTLARIRQTVGVDLIDADSSSGAISNENRVE